MQRKQTGVFVFPAVGTSNGNNKGKIGSYFHFPSKLQLSQTHEPCTATFSLKLLMVNVKRHGAFKSSAFIQNPYNFPFTLLPKVFDSIAFETAFKILARLTYLELPK